MEQLYRQDLILGLLPSKENALNIAAIHERVTNSSIFGQTAAGWGSTPTAAVASLLANTPLAMRSCALDALLVIEANYDLTWGDYASVMEQVGKAIGHDAVPTGWMTANYSGYGLKLLVFSPS